jgi:HTH-type transcriptional regulator, sugar sensing transcriptional regulator
MEPLKRRALEELGLSKNEIEVFLVLMRLGSSTAGQVTKETGLHRRNTYDALEKLVQKGLVGHVSSNKIRHYETTDPSRILDLIREKRSHIQDTEKGLESLLPELLKMREARGTQDISIFTGKEGRRLIFDDILRNAKENLVLVGVPPSDSSVGYMKRYNRKRASLGILDRMIYNKKHEFIDFLKTLDHTEVRLLPRELKSGVSFNIYGSNVAILFRISGEPMTILIRNGGVANDFREYFNFLWDLSKPA